jgi:hypothetical protein
MCLCREAEVDQMLMYGDMALQLVYLVRKGLWSGHNNIMISSPTEHEAPGHPLHATVQHLKNEKKKRDNEGDNEGDLCEEGLHLSLYCKQYSRQPGRVIIKFPCGPWDTILNCRPSTASKRTATYLC